MQPGSRITSSKPVTVQKFTRLKCLHGTDHLFDGIGQKFDLDFAGRKFILLASQIFVRFGWFRVNETPKRANFGSVKYLAGTV